MAAEGPAPPDADPAETEIAETEIAVEGLIDSIGHRNRLHSGVLRFFRWIDGRPLGSRVAYFLAGWLAYRFLYGRVSDHPALAGFAQPLVAMWVAVLLLTWVAKPLSDFLLTLCAEGRRLVRGERRLAATLVTGLVTLAVAATLAALMTGSERASVTALATAFVALPVKGVFDCAPGWPRKTMLTYAGVAGTLTLVTVAGPITASRVAVVLAVMLSVVASWVAVVLRRRVPVG